MAAVTTEYYEFTGPGFLTLLRNKTLVGKAYIQYQDTAGKWSRLYDADGEPVAIGWPAETVPVDVPDGTLWRAVASYFDCDDNSVEFAFYNADLGNQPVVDLPEYNGSPIRCDNKAYRGGYTTYFQKFDGSGVLGLVDPGKLASPAWVNLLLSENPDRSAPYYIDGERAELGTGVESIEIKHAGPVLVGYQVANCFEDDVVFSMTPVDYTGGAETPLPITVEFVSGEVPVDTNGSYILVTLSGVENGSATPEWSIKINGADVPLSGVEGRGTTEFLVSTGVLGAIVEGDVVTVSHTEGSGIVAFTDQPITNNLVAPIPPAAASKKKKAKRKVKK